MMHVVYFWSRKWLKLLILMVLLYAVIKILIIDRNSDQFYNHFVKLRNFKMWTSYRSSYNRISSPNLVDVVDVLPNCGIAHVCPDDTFPAHIHTGHPKLCIMGKYLTNHANHGGRGLNIALIDPKRLILKDLVTFDVYDENSIAMEVWINSSVKETDILLIFTYDEASRMLRESSRKLFYSLGSSKIQDLHFRSQWYMISQKGIKGFTPFEKVTMPRDGHWGEPIDERFCVP